MIFQYGAAICAPNQSFSERGFPLREINMEQLFPLEIRFFILQFRKNLKINMEQLFALQMDSFLSGAPQGCELQEKHIKHKVWEASSGHKTAPCGPGGEEDIPRPYVL